MDAICAWISVARWATIAGESADAAARDSARALSDLTLAWLTGALRAAGHLGAGAVVSAQVAPIGQGVGVLCQLARIAVEYDRPGPGAPATLVAKLPTADLQTRGMVSRFRFYEREVRFYREDRFGDAVPPALRAIGFARSVEDYRRAVLFCFVYPVMAGGLGDLSNERGRALAMAVRSAAALSDWNAEELLG